MRRGAPSEQRGAGTKERGAPSARRCPGTKPRGAPSEQRGAGTKRVGGSVRFGRSFSRKASGARLQRRTIWLWSIVYRRLPHGTLMASTTPIPNQVIAVVSDVIGSLSSHTRIDTLFMEAGFPGDPPAGNRVVKAQTWLRAANSQATKEPIVLLGSLLQLLAFAVRPDGSNDERAAWQRIITALENNGMGIDEGWKLVTTQEKPPVRMSAPQRGGAMATQPIWHYHVCITLSKPLNETIYSFDLLEEKLRSAIIDKYNRGESITLRGRTTRMQDVKSVQVSRSREPGQVLLDRARQEEENSSVVMIPPLTDYTAWKMGEDVTEDWIQGEPGYLRDQSPTATRTASVAQPSPSVRPNARDVFVVHGHDHGLKNAVARFLEILTLKAIILHEQPDGGKTVIEKFEAAANVAFAVVLATADDYAGASSNAVPAVANRARQNVIFELGYFRAKLGGASVALVRDDKVDLPSDLAGVVYIARRGWQAKLFTALTDAGFKFEQADMRRALAVED